jgi:hypothetical protein
MANVVQVWVKATVAGTYRLDGNANAADGVYYISTNIFDGTIYYVKLITESVSGAHSSTVEDYVTATSTPSDFTGGGVYERPTTTRSTADIQNSNFELGNATVFPPAGWAFEGAPTLSYNTSSPYAGSRSLHLSVTDRYTGVQAATKYICNPNDQYTFTAAIRYVSGGMQPRVSLWFGDGSGAYKGAIVINAVSSDTNWHLLTTSGTVPAGATFFWINSDCEYITTASATVWEIDAIKLVRVTRDGEVVLTTSTFLNSQGSIPPVQTFVWGTTTVNPTAFTLNWSAQSLPRGDGTTLAVSAGSKTYSGLASSTTYRVYPYIRISDGTIQFANGAPPPTTANAAYALAAALDGRVDLGVITVTTQASGGTGGGYIDPSPCPEQSELVTVEGRGEITASQVVAEDRILGRSIATGEDVYRLVVFTSTDVCRTWRLVDGHRVTSCEPIYKDGWVPAFRVPGAAFDIYDGRKVNITIESDEYDESNYYIGSGDNRLLIHNRPITS